LAVHIGPKKLPKSALKSEWDDLDPRTKAAASPPAPARQAVPKRVPYNVSSDDFPADGPVAWDEIDRLSMRADAELVVPTMTRSGANRRIAIYARYSSEQQNPASIEIQEKDGVRYYRKFGGTGHTLFRDDARTGTDTDREGLQALLRAVENGEFDIVIIWSFDRLARETYDGVPVIQFLEMHGVELHIARKGRRVTKREAIIDAVQAEEENALRIDRITNGLNDFVQKGGLPWGWHYGLVPTRRRGFPARDTENTAKIVKRITLDIVYKSGDMIADELNAEGVEPPSGKGLWDGWTVLFIAQNVANTGRIHYRKTGLYYDTKTKSWVRKPNPEYMWIRGRNENIRLVEDHEYVAAVTAIQARNTRLGGAVQDKSNHALPIFGNPICDCPDRKEEQRFLLNYVDESKCSHRYKCSNGKERCCSDAQSFVGDDIEKAIFDATAPRLAPWLDGFDGEFKDSLIEIDRVNVVRRAGENETLKELRDQSRRLLRQSIRDSHDEDDHKAVALEVKTQIQESKRRLALIPEIQVDAIDFGGVRENLFSALSMLRDRLPFVPQSHEEVELVEALRTGVLGILISRQGRLRGSFRIRIAAQWERYVLSEEQVIACDFQPEIIETECHLEPSYTNLGSVAHMSELAASGLHALSDEQWALVKDQLPNLSITESNGSRTSDTRMVLHLLLFMTRMKVPLTRPPEYFGTRREAYNAILRLVMAGGIEVLQQTFGSDPTWSEGLDFSRFDKLPRSKRPSTQPTLTAARAAERGEYDLTDDQWASIEHLFVGKVLNPISGKPAVIDMRTAMDGILTKLRTGCAWKKLPERFGGGVELLNIMQRMHYHRVWDRVRDIFLQRFPEILEGLPDDPFPGWARRRVKGAANGPLMVGNTAITSSAGLPAPGATGSSQPSKPRRRRRKS